MASPCSEDFPVVWEEPLGVGVEAAREEWDVRRTGVVGARREGVGEELDDERGA